MKILLLGTGGYHPSEIRHTACMMLPEAGIILDAGTAMFRARKHLQTNSLDIFLTHTHLDHVVGLTFLFDILRDDQMTMRRLDHLRVHGDHKKLDAVRQHMFSEHLFPALPPIEWVDLNGPVLLAKQTTITPFPLTHPGGCIGYRLDWPDRSMAYVTDTTADIEADYVDAIQGVDLLLHECYLPDGAEDRAQLAGHSCLTPVVQVAKRANVGRLILIHINALAPTDAPVDMERARSIFPNTRLSVDQMEVILEATTSD